MSSFPFEVGEILRVCGLCRKRCYREKHLCSSKSRR